MDNSFLKRFVTFSFVTSYLQLWSLLLICLSEMESLSKALLKWCLCCEVPPRWPSWRYSICYFYHGLRCTGINVFICMVVLSLRHRILRNHQALAESGTNHLYWPSIKTCILITWRKIELIHWPFKYYAKCTLHSLQIKFIYLNWLFLTLQ